MTATQSVSAARSLSTSSAWRRLSSNSALVSGGFCDAEDLRVELLAAKHAVLLERGNREDPLRDLGVGDRQAQAPGLGHGGPLVNQLPQDLTGPRPAA